MKKTKMIISVFFWGLGLFGFFSAASAESLNNDNWLFNETYRNQYHYSTEKNWINDPNGLVYDDTTGIYHMFYQYNPYENAWGNMSWGHATSKDLLNWKEQKVAIPELENQEWVDFSYTNTTGSLAQYGEVKYIGKPTTNWGNGEANGKKYIFSGSTIIDKNNVSGLGKNTLLAYFTSSYQVATRKNDGLENGLGTWIGFNEVQEQHLAYSLDGGKTFQHYSPDGNSEQPKAIVPVTQLSSGEAKDFRDPKVVYDEEHGQWLMIVVSGQEAQLYKSKDLLNWSYASTIIREHDYGVGVWECPELIPMKVNETGETKWVLTMSVQENAYASGSGMQYMVGDMDDQGVFKPKSDTTLSHPTWLDYGEDFYAGVTFNNAPDDRKIMLAWMSNWKYISEQKTTPWYGHMTIPRELTLHKKDSGNDGYELRQEPIAELEGIEKDSLSLKTDVGLKLDNQEALVTNYKGKNYKIETEFSWSETEKPQNVGLYLRATDDLSRRIYVGYDLTKEVAYVDRLTTGESGIEGPDRNKTNTKVTAKDNKIKVTAYVDESSIEVFINDHEKTISQVFYFRPELIGDVSTDSIAFVSDGGKATVDLAKLTPLRSIYGEITISPNELNIEKDVPFNLLNSIQLTNTLGNGQIETLTNNIIIKENTVNTSIPGIYNLTIGASNSSGKYQEKVIPVTVGEKEVETVESIHLNASGIKTLKKGTTFQVQPSFIPQNAMEPIVWTTTKEEVATIDSAGLITARKEGITIITAETVNHKKATFTLRVTK